MNTSAPTVESELSADAWSALGEHLARPDLSLVGDRLRRRFVDEWQEICERERNLDDTLVIGLVGGTGVGKSTFINAVAGEEVSRSGDRRPTTDRVVVYRHVENDLADRIPSRDLGRPQVQHRNAALERVVLLDFPDFDSAETTHRQILLRYLPHLDVLFIVVDDVKYGDRRLYDLIRGLGHHRGNLFAVLNKVDLLKERYGERWESVARDILEDLREKLSVHAGVEFDVSRTIHLSALRAFENRRGGRADRAEGEFSRVHEVLREFRQAKRRRAAKELNLGVRKRQLAESVGRAALTDENRDVLESASLLVREMSGELDRLVGGVPPTLLSEHERRGLRRARLRRVGPAWGFPFSLVFTILNEFRRGRRASRSSEGEVGRRALQHYRTYLDALKNLRARFASEVSDSPLGERHDEPRKDASLEDGALLPWVSQLAGEFQTAIASTERLPGRGRKVLAHALPLGALALGVWSLFHPLVKTLVHGTGGWSSLLGEAVKSAVTALNPFFLLGLLGGTVVLYGLSALCLWLRELQVLDAGIVRAERALHSEVRRRGHAVIDELRERVSSFRQDFETLEEVLSDVLPPASPRRDATGPGLRGAPPS